LSSGFINFAMILPIAYIFVQKYPLCILQNRSFNVYGHNKDSIRFKEKWVNLLIFQGCSLRIVGCRVFKAFHSYNLVMFLSGYWVVILYLWTLQHILPSEYLQRRISKSVPPYLGRSLGPTKYEIATEVK
jgi:hypothetical protein